MAWIKPDLKGFERDGYKLGFGYGVQTEFRLQENYSIASGVQVSYRGGSLNYKTASSADSSVDYTLQYVEIPLTLKMLTNQFNKTRIFGQFGFSPGLNIRSHINREINGDDDFMDYVNLLNVNMIIGAGIEYTISGSTVLFAGLEFNNGFVNVFDKKTDDLTPEGVGKMKGVSNFLGLSAGVLF